MRAATARIHKDVKTGTYAGLKWALTDSAFCLMLPETPAAAPAITFLRARVEPMAVYMTKTGRPSAWQWVLGKRAWRAIWVDPKVRELE